jgi:aspartate/methionine/tyrosine aminotransferase
VTLGWEMEEEIVGLMRPLAERSQTIPRSGIRQVFELAQRVPGTIHLEMGQPDFPTPPHVIQAAYEAGKAGYTTYTPSAGLPSVREAMAGKVSRENGYDVTTDNVVVSAGGLGGLLVTLFTLVDPGDDVLIPSPGYPMYTILSRMCGAVPVYYPLKPRAGFHHDHDILVASTTGRTKAIILNSPGNPTGTVTPLGELQSLLEHARQHNLWVLSDEAYEKIVYDAVHVSPASLDDDGRVVSIYSLSKTYSMTGWRIGFVTAVSDVAAQIAKTQESMLGCVSSVSQKAAEAALLGPQDTVESMVAAYRRRRELVVNTLKQYDLFQYCPEGAFYFLVDISQTGVPSCSFVESLVRAAGVAVAPGSTFGPTATDFVRVSFAGSEGNLVEGLSRLCKFIKNGESLPRIAEL